MRDQNRWLKSIQYLEETHGGDIDKLAAEQAEESGDLDEFWDMIDEEFDGDVQKYELAAAKSRQELKESELRSKAACFMPDQDAITKEIIEVRLGYLANVLLSLPHELFIRALLNKLKAGLIAMDEFKVESDKHIMDIRNADMKESSWLDRLEYNQSDLERYNSYLVEYKEQAQNKFKTILGYVPLLDYALEAEIYLREFLANVPELSERVTIVDFRAITIAKYRETLILHGSHAADAAPLQGGDWDCCEHILKTHNFLI